jgi:hypothetical protein
MRPEFESWNLTYPLMRSRCRLYSPGPEGIGTPFVESLSGYVVRLAESHAVSTGDLVLRELSRGIKPPLVLYWNDLNGLEERAARWVRAVEAATLRTDLRYLTLLPFRNLFPRPMMLRRTRAWCPECYQAMADTGMVYDPLLWCFKLVEVCHRHRRLLTATCSHCCRPFRPICSCSRTGRCPRCESWLGHASQTLSKTPAPTEYQLWLADAMGQLLAHASEVQPDTLWDRVRGILTACTHAFAEGNCAAFAEAAGCTPEMIQHWLNGVKRPRIDNLLSTWFRLNLPVALMFSKDWAELLRQGPLRMAPKIERTHKVAPKRRREQIQAALKEALTEQPPRGLTDVARSLGYVTTTRLRDADPALCTQIVINHRRSGRSHWWVRRGAKPICELSYVRRVLEGYLQAQARIPPLDRIAASLGYAADQSLRQKCPELCRALSAKLASQREARVAAIEPALKQALQETPPPTVREVCKRLGFSAGCVLKAHATVLYERLKVRGRDHAEACRTEVQGKLKAMLSEVPPPPPKEVYARLGVTEAICIYNFPELRRAIVARYRQHRAQRCQARREAVREEIRAIVRQLHTQGVCPSVPRVAGLLKGPSLGDWKLLSEFVNSARRELSNNCSV